MQNNPIIQISNLHKYYGKEHILRGVDLEVHQGQLVTLIGRSGCGKTTLLRCMNCLEIFDQGFMSIADISLERNPNSEKAIEHNKSDVSDIDKLNDKSLREKAYKLRVLVGMVFQNFNLFPHLNVIENVMLALQKVKKMEKDEAYQVASKTLTKVGMNKYAERKPHQISGGQSQRVAIARALAMNPKVMLYDEPTSALDINLANEVLEVMLNLHSEGMTQIIVTHDIKFAQKASNYIVYMQQGEVIEKSKPETIFNNPQDERTREYLKLFS